MCASLEGSDGSWSGVGCVWCESFGVSEQAQCTKDLVAVGWLIAWELDEHEDLMLSVWKQDVILSVETGGSPRCVMWYIFEKKVEHES